MTQNTINPSKAANSSTRPDDHVPQTPGADDSDDTPTTAPAADNGQAQQPSSGNWFSDIFGGFFQAILSFFQSIFGKPSDAPNESAADSQPVDAKATGAEIHKFFDSHAMEKWKELQANSDGKPINFIDPIASGAKVSSGYGARAVMIKGESGFHRAVDLTGSGNVVASADGVVMFSGRFKGYGEVVALGHADGSTTVYAEMSGAKMPEIGALVPVGGVIGVVGDTGISTGTHLHYEQHAAGTNAKIAPVIDGVRVVKDQALGSDVELASLVNAKDYANLPVYTVKNGGTPTALAFAATKTSLGTHLS